MGFERFKIVTVLLAAEAGTILVDAWKLTMSHNLGVRVVDLE